MTLKKQILNMLADMVCEYLRLDRNLFFTCARDRRVKEGREYMVYLAVKVYAIPPNFVAKYLSCDRLAVAIWVDNARSAACGWHRPQTRQDIETLEDMCYKHDTKKLEAA